MLRQPQKLLFRNPENLTSLHYWSREVEFHLGFFVNITEIVCLRIRGADADAKMDADAVDAVVFSRTRTRKRTR